MMRTTARERATVTGGTSGDRAPGGSEGLPGDRSDARRHEPPEGGGATDRSADRAAGLTSRMSLFTEVAVVGVAVAVAGITVVLAVPVMAAGAAHLRRHLAGEPDTVRRLLTDARDAVRDLWPLALAVPAALALLATNVWAGLNGLPGGTVVAAVSAAAAVAVTVVALRVVGTWEPGRSWRPAVRAAASRSVTDLTGSVLLVAAVAMVATMVWMLLPLLLLAGGLLTMAALAVERRAGR